MSGKQILIIVIALIVVGLIVYFASTTPNEPTVPNGDTIGGEAAPIGESAAPGTSLVTEGGDVVTETGEPVKMDAEPGSPEAPQQSEPLSEAPKDSVEVGVSAAGFNPAEFTVNSGDAITLSITSADSQTHIFKFRDESLKGVAVGIAPGETRAISFNAPAKGEYEFYCDVPGHDSRGEHGVMIVK